MITSRSTEKHRRQASKSGVNSYFVKPFNEDYMLDSVMELTQKQSKATDALGRG
jgi:DNA-binding response OmpR family regulator